MKTSSGLDLALWLWFADPYPGTLCSPCASMFCFGFHSKDQGPEPRRRKLLAWDYTENDSHAERSARGPLLAKGLCLGAREKGWR